MEINNVDLKELLNLALGSASRTAISSGLAAKIAAADPEEKLCHVELPSVHNDYECPHVWWAEDWQTNYRRETQRRHVQHLERAVWVLQTEMTVKLCLGVATQLLSSDAEANRITAETVVKCRSVESAAFFGVNIAELLEADLALSEYRLSLKRAKL